MHIQVESCDGMAKFEIENEIRFIENNGLKPKDLKLAESILEENLENFRVSWIIKFLSKLLAPGFFGSLFYGIRVL